MAHRARAEHRASYPVHLTLRARAGLPSLRGRGMFEVVQEALRAASWSKFRVVHFSVQSDHLHLIVEAGDGRSLALGARGLTIRVARAINRHLGRPGKVWGDRYQARALRTPREVRNGIVYVLMNVKKHRPWDRQALDPCSSARWFDGLDPRPPAAKEPSPVYAARTWLGAVGWRRHGMVKATERPAASC